MVPIVAVVPVVSAITTDGVIPMVAVFTMVSVFSRAGFQQLGWLLMPTETLPGLLGYVVVARQRMREAVSSSLVFVAPAVASR